MSEPRTPTDIQFVHGDATAPQGEGIKIIAHVCNDIGAWGKGFVLAVSKRWPEPEAVFRKWATTTGSDSALGSVQFVQVEPSMWVANMIGQHGIKRSSSTPPIRYTAIGDCLKILAAKALELGASVHMPRIGCGLAGGEWSKIEPLVQEHLCDHGVNVTVYDYQ